MPNRGPAAAGRRRYHACVTVRLIRYSVGNENDPGDPWGRSELVVEPDGSARLDHYFSRVATTGSWSGRIDVATLDRLWSALDQAGFPARPTKPLVAGSAVRRLTVETDGRSDHTMIGWHEAASLPGYAEAFGILDAAISQLSAGAVPYPTTEATIVHDSTAV